MGSCWKAARRLFHIHTQLVPLKATVFFLYGAIFSLVPFLQVHARHVGLSIPSTTTVYAVLVIASFVGSPVAGYFTDKVGRFKLVFGLVVALCVLAHNALLFVPSVSLSERAAKTELLCTRSGLYLFTESCSLPSQRCPLSDDGGNDAVVDFVSCRADCKESESSGPFPAADVDSRVCLQYEQQLQPHRHKYGPCQPLEDLVRVTSDNFSLASWPLMFTGKEECVHRVMSAHWEGQLVRDPQCPAWGPKCRLVCDAHLRHRNGSYVACLDRSGNPDTTFYVYCFLRFLSMVLLGAVFSLTEAAILTKAKQHGGDYGKQRVWGVIAKAAIIPLTERFIHLAEKSGQVSFYPSFLVFDVFMCLAFILIVTTLDLDTHSQPQLKFTVSSELLRRWEALLLYAAVFCLGAFYGFLDSFLYKFLRQFGVSAFLLDVSQNVGRLVCIPTMFFADTIMNKVGRVNILVAAFLCYAVQMLCYSLIGNPWWCLALEVLKFFTSCLKLASVITLANNVAPPKLVATMQGTVHCLQYGIGSGMGLLVGGFIVDTYSTRAALRVFGILSGLFGFVYAVSYYAIRKKERSKADGADTSYPDPQFEVGCRAESRV